jgi:DNA-binding CsgD family transcriptional regulator
VQGFDGNRLVLDLAKAATPDERFEILTKGVGQLGIDVVNYGFFDQIAARKAATDIQFMTTMTDGWMAHYYDSQLAASDSHVLRVQAGQISPYLWGASSIERLESRDEKRTAREGAEEGLKSGLFVPMASPLDPFSPVAGIALAGSLSEAEFGKLVAEHGVALLHIAYVFHNASIRTVWMEQAGGKPLTERESDCMRFLADGLRQDAIADVMGIARVTVEMHLRSARQKLRARTLTEAVAKSILFDQLGAH